MSSSQIAIIEILEKISLRLDKIEERLDKIEGSANKMDGHINFVENLYDAVKMPFHSLFNFIGQSKMIMRSPPLLLEENLLENNK